MRAWPIAVLLPFCFGHFGGCGHDEVVGAEGAAAFEVELEDSGRFETFVHLDVWGPTATVEIVLDVEGRPLSPGAIALGMDAEVAGPSPVGVLRQARMRCEAPCVLEQRIVVLAEAATHWAFEARVRMSCEECGDTPPDIRVNVHDHR